MNKKSLTLTIALTGLGLTTIMLLNLSTPSESPFTPLTAEIHGIIPNSSHQVTEGRAVTADTTLPQPGETELTQSTIGNAHVVLGQNMSFVPVEELPPAYANANYTAVDVVPLDLTHLEQGDTIELFVPQISDSVAFQVGEVSEDEYGVSVRAWNQSTGNILALSRSDPLHAEGYLEIDNVSYSVIQHQNKWLIADAKGFFRVYDGDQDDTYHPDHQPQ
jgi:hypothetical protein